MARKNASNLDNQISLMDMMVLESPEYSEENQKKTKKSVRMQKTTQNRQVSLLIPKQVNQQKQGRVSPHRP